MMTDCEDMEQGHGAAEHKARREEPFHYDQSFRRVRAAEEVRRQKEIDDEPF